VKESDIRVFDEKSEMEKKKRYTLGGLGIELDS